MGSALDKSTREGGQFSVVITTASSKNPILPEMDIGAQKNNLFSPPAPCFTGSICFYEPFLLKQKMCYLPEASSGNHNPKRYFLHTAIRACPTNGSDCGSLHSHNLTLFVMNLLMCYWTKLIDSSMSCSRF